MYADKFVT